LPLCRRHPMRIVLAERRPIVRVALRALLEQDQEVRVVGEAVDVDELLVKAGEICPELVLLDWTLVGRDPAKLLSSLHDLCPSVRIIVMSADPGGRASSLEAGADSFVSMSDAPDTLLRTLEECRQMLEERPEG
jgi:DNA-binding NarL/FixJ family response regulator